MKGPSLYSSSPMKQDTRADGFGRGAKQGVKNDPVKRTEGKLKKKDKSDEKSIKQGVKNDPVTKPKKSFKNPDGSVNIPVNPNAPKPVKAPKNNTSIHGTTQFQRDTKAIRNAVGRTKRGVKKVINIHKKAANKVKDYFTKT